MKGVLVVITVVAVCLMGTGVGSLLRSLAAEKVIHNQAERIKELREANKLLQTELATYKRIVDQFQPYVTDGSKNQPASR